MKHIDLNAFDPLPLMGKDVVAKPTVATDVGDTSLPEGHTRFNELKSLGDKSSAFRSYAAELKSIMESLGISDELFKSPVSSAFRDSVAKKNDCTLKVEILKARNRGSSPAHVELNSDFQSGTLGWGHTDSLEPGKIVVMRGYLSPVSYQRVGTEVCILTTRRARTFTLFSRTYV